MDSRVYDEMLRVVDHHFQVAALNDFMKICLEEKKRETHIWSELTICMHFMLTGHSPLIYRLGAYTELIILALDMIDDLTDQDSHLKVWMTYPRSLVLNASIALLVAGLGEISKLKEANLDRCLPLTGEINDLLTLAANGQHRDMHNEAIETEEEYISIILGKSAPLKIFACYMGYACVEHCSKSMIEQINEMAKHLAIVAQIQNDLHDLLQFDVKNDLLHKKRTIPILYLLSLSAKNSIIKDYYEGIISREEFISNKLEGVEYIRKSGCIEYSKVIQGLYLNLAEGIFNEIPGDAFWKARFYDIAFGIYKVV